MEPDKNSQEEAKKDDVPAQPQVDAFGVEVKVTDVEVVDVKDEKKEEPKKEADPVALAQQVGTLTEQVKQLNDKNLKKDEDIRAMADKIKRYEKENGGEQKGGEKQEGDVLFKEIKTSKDLTADEKEEMTDAEIKALDEMAALKTTMNQMHQALNAKTAAPEFDVAGSVKEKALAAAGNDVEVANKIIDAFNGQKFNTKEMTAEDVQRAIDLVSKTVTEFKPKKEETVIPGQGKPAGTSKSDPHGVDGIIKSVQKQSEGGTYEL
ncbi:hypothetical protein A2Z56_02440 [Candidatus Kaiserbacteria bacterium RIFCSPHIGHO2_12_45_16]|nr:MAG: hypothetical protein A2Z56_02440 [Candidatus Kaiserbacteria bacterium RIFCSPHIGHO2_12_45_16]